jgi:hypothetical protein
MATASFNTLLINPRLRLMTGDALRLPLFDGFPIKSARIHEWFSEACLPGHHLWYPPLTLLAALACRSAVDEKVRIVWIGRQCWPMFQLLSAMGRHVQPVFLHPPSDAERFWAIGQAMRCPGVHAVVADGSGMTQTISRRLQLAAESALVLGLIARPPWEIHELSCAATRWQVRPGKSDRSCAAWDIELLSCRGQRVGQDVPQYWNADWNYQVFLGTGALHLSPHVGRRSDLSPDEGAQARSRTA